MIYLLFTLILLVGALGMRLLFLRHRLRVLQEQLKRVTTGWSETALHLPDNDRLLQPIVEDCNRLIRVLQLNAENLRKLNINNRQMIASIAHDFRTPLTSIVGYVQLLQEAELTDVRRLRYFSIIEKRLQNLSAMIEDFYTQSLIDAAEYPMKETKIYPVALLQSSLALYYDDLECRFSKLDIEFLGETYFMWADKLALERVFANLLKNCSMHGSGLLFIRSAPSGSSPAEKRILRIKLHNQVNDLPEHFDPEVLFERSFRLPQGSGLFRSALSSSPAQSSGLGLSIARGLLRGMGGDLSASVRKEDDPAGGAHLLCFQLDLPVVGEDEI